MFLPIISDECEDMGLYAIGYYLFGNYRVGCDYHFDWKRWKGQLWHGKTEWSRAMENYASSIQYWNIRFEQINNSEFFTG